MSETQTIYLVVLVLEGKGQIIHIAFTEIEKAAVYAKKLEPTIRKNRKDFIRCDVVPVQLQS
jgi:hypothetical protein